MKKQLLIALAILLIFIGCGGVDAPKPSEEITKRPSLIYQPNGLNRMQMMYPLTVGIFKIKDKRVLPFYTGGDFFQEKDVDGLHQMTYLELKKSGLFARVKMIDEEVPKNIDEAYLQSINKKYGVDMIFSFDLTDFNLFRAKQGKALEYWDNSSRKNYAGGAFTIEVLASMIGQLIYYDGGYIVWSGEVTRRDKIAVKDGGLTTHELSQVTKQTLQPLFLELKKHIATNGKRMAQ